MDGPRATAIQYAVRAPVAQLDRVLVSEAKGHRFESCRARHSSRRTPLKSRTRPRRTRSFASSSRDPPQSNDRRNAIPTPLAVPVSARKVIARVSAYSSRRVLVATVMPCS